VTHTEHLVDLGCNQKTSLKTQFGFVVKFEIMKGCMDDTRTVYARCLVKIAAALAFLLACSTEISLCQVHVGTRRFRPVVVDSLARNFIHLKYVKHTLTSYLPVSSYSTW
jgi:hypothetical protein